MPTVAHDPWCTEHDDETLWGPAGQCGHGRDFGPVLSDSETEMTAGRLAAHRASSPDADGWGTELKVYLDYRTTWGGYMDAAALRALHEALQEDPEGLRRTVEQMMADLGEAIPPRHGSVAA